MNIIEQLENAERLTKGRNALECVKQREKEEKAHGYRYITLNGRTKVLVECDESGNPTPRGQRQLEAIKKIIW